MAGTPPAASGQSLKASEILQRILDEPPGVQIITISRERLEEIQKKARIIELVAAGLACQVHDQEARQAASSGDPGID